MKKGGPTVALTLLLRQYARLVSAGAPVFDYTRTAKQSCPEGTTWTETIENFANDGDFQEHWQMSRGGKGSYNGALRTELATGPTTGWE